MHRNVIVVLLMTLIFGRQNQNNKFCYFFLNSYFLTYSLLSFFCIMSSVTRDSDVKSLVL